MTIFKTLTLKWWQTGLFKLSMIALGIILGVYFQAFFMQYMAVVVIVFIVTAIYVLKVWWTE